MSLKYIFLNRLIDKQTFFYNSQVNFKKVFTCEGSLLNNKFCSFFLNLCIIGKNLSDSHKHIFYSYILRPFQHQGQYDILTSFLCLHLKTFMNILFNLDHNLKASKINKKPTYNMNIILVRDPNFISVRKPYYVKYCI